MGTALGMIMPKYIARSEIHSIPRLSWSGWRGNVPKISQKHMRDTTAIGNDRFDVAARCSEMFQYVYWVRRRNWDTKMITSTFIRETVWRMYDFSLILRMFYYVHISIGEYEEPYKFSFDTVRYVNVINETNLNYISSKI